MLKESTFFGEVDKVETAIMRLKEFEPAEGYYLAFSGGKDSVVIKALADMAKVKYDAHYNLTTIDPPELVRFIKDEHKDVIVDMPDKPFLERMLSKGFPRRQFRWCCTEYKEHGGKDRFVITGVRWAESSKRKNRRMVESCMKGYGKKFLNVIIDWTDDDIWEFIKGYKVPYCKLYDEGWKRIGCLFCPNAPTNQRQKETRLYPVIAKNFIKAFEKLHKKNKDKGNKSVDRWKDGEEMFNWWISKNDLRYNPDQTVMFE